jgi:hypothetical protein
VLVGTLKLLSSCALAVVRLVVLAALSFVLWISSACFLHGLLAIQVVACCFWLLFGEQISFVLACLVLLAQSML